MVIKVLVSIPQDVLEAEDIAEAILYGLTAPPRVDVSVTILDGTFVDTEDPQIETFHQRL